MAKGRYILAAGRRLPYIYAVSLDAASGSGVLTALQGVIVGRGKLAMQAWTGVLLGDPANPVVSEDSRTLNAANDHVLVDNAVFARARWRVEHIVVLDTSTIWKWRNCMTATAFEIRWNTDSGGFGGARHRAPPEMLVIVNARNQPTEDGGTGITPVDRRTGRLPPYWCSCAGPRPGFRAPTTRGPTSSP